MRQPMPTANQLTDRTASLSSKTGGTAAERRSALWHPRHASGSSILAKVPPSRRWTEAVQIAARATAYH